jgi:hygromycin-B 7''-O-kinase
MKAIEIVVRSHAEWGRIFTDAAVWRPLVEEICRRHGIADARDVRAGFPGSNAVFVVDDRAVVKIAAPFWREDFAREQEVTAFVAGRTGLPAPRLLAHGTITAGDEWPYFAMSHVPGQRIGDVWERIPAGDRGWIAEALGRMTRAIHDLSLAGLTHLDTTSAGWERFLQGQIEQCAAHHAEGSLPAHLVEQIPEFLAGLDLLSLPSAPCLLNADITEDHVLVAESPQGWEITGLIDFGDAMAGDLEYEFVAVARGALGGDRAAFRRFLAGYGRASVDPRFPRRLLAWALLHRFSDMRPHVARLGGPRAVRRLEDLQAALWGE